LRGPAARTQSSPGQRVDSNSRRADWRKAAGSKKAAVSDAIKRVVGGKVSIDMKVDPGLLGGLIVRVGSRMIDGSVKTKLQKLQLAMKGVG